MLNTFRILAKTTATNRFSRKHATQGWQAARHKPGLICFNTANLRRFSGLVRISDRTAPYTLAYRANGDSGMHA
jgi:hypothetical protein